MRTGAYGRWTAWQSWRAALRTAALMLLALNVASAVAALLGQDQDAEVSDAAKITFGVLATVAVLRNLFAVAIGATAAMIAVNGIVVLDGHVFHVPLGPGASSFAPWLVVAFLLPLVGRGPVRVARSLNVLAALVLIPAGLWIYHSAVLVTAYANASRASWWYLLAAAVLWAVVDERLALTVGLVLLYNVAYQFSIAWGAIRYGQVDIWMLPPIAIALIMPVIGITSGVVAARRRARL
jgi:hypothetical protein